MPVNGGGDGWQNGIVEIIKGQLCRPGLQGQRFGRPHNLGNAKGLAGLAELFGELIGLSGQPVKVGQGNEGV